MSTPLKLDPTLQTPRPEPEMRPGPAKTPSEPKPEPKSKSESKDSSTIFGQAKQTLDLITDNAVGGAVSLAYELADKTKAAVPVEALAKLASPLSVITASKGLADAVESGNVEASIENGLSITANTIGTAAAWMGRTRAEVWLPRLSPAGSVIAAGVGGYSLGKSGDAYLRRQNGASPADLATTKAVQTHDGILKLTGSRVLAEAMGLHELGRGMIDAVVPTVTGGVLSLGERVLEATGLKKPRA
jgi:hypothetical protein